MDRELNPEAATRVVSRIARTNPDICRVSSADWEEVTVNAPTRSCGDGRSIACIGPPTDFVDGVHHGGRERAESAVRECVDGAPVEIECRVND